MRTVEGRIGAIRSGSPSLSFGDEVLATADGDVGDEHRAGMLIEQWTQAGQNRLDPFFRHDREDDHLAAGVVKQQMAFMKAMVTFAGHIVDDRVAAGADPIQQVSDKLQMLALDHDLDFFHEMQC